MPDEQPQYQTDSASPEAVPGPVPASGTGAPRIPFWSYHDLLLFLGLIVAAGLASALVAKIVFAILHIRTGVAALEPLLAQTLLDVCAFSILAGMFRLEYDEPFWRSLAWLPGRVGSLWPLTAGLLTAVVIAFLAYIIHLPTVENPMTRLMEDRVSVLLMAAFGVTLAPLFEELVFRGFLQPLLVRSLGPIPGIVLTALPFGLLHFREYGNSWRHAVLISAAGAAFGWMRHRSGSTRASTLMHASYNALNFVALFAGREDFPHAW